MTVATEQPNFAENSAEQQTAPPTPGEALSQLVRGIATETLDIPNPHAWVAIMAKLDAVTGISPARRWRLRQMVWQARYLMRVERRAARK